MKNYFTLFKSSISAPRKTGGGGGGGRQPGTDTVAYYPLAEDWEDHSGNGYDLTNAGGSITTLGSVNCAYFSGSKNIYSVNTSAPVGETRTIACWTYLTGPTNGSATAVWTGTYDAYSGQHNAEVLGAYNGKTSLSDFHTYGVSGNTSILNQWVLLVGVVTGNDVICYLNGAVDASGTRGYTSTESVGIKLSGRLGGSGSEYIKGYLSEVIVENIAWTADQVSAYYNQTKSKYGL